MGTWARARVRVRVRLRLMVRVGLGLGLGPGHRGGVGGVVGRDDISRPEHAAGPDEGSLLEGADLAQPAARPDADALEASEARA